MTFHPAIVASCREIFEYDPVLGDYLRFADVSV